MIIIAQVEGSGTDLTSLTAAKYELPAKSLPIKQLTPRLRGAPVPQKLSGVVGSEAGGTSDPKPRVSGVPILRRLKPLSPGFSTHTCGRCKEDNVIPGKVIFQASVTPAMVAPAKPTVSVSAPPPEGSVSVMGMAILAAIVVAVPIKRAQAAASQQNDIPHPFLP